MLTVAFDERPHPALLEGLRRLTGQVIFPVLVRRKRMLLLLHRAEFCRRYRVSPYHYYYLHRFFIHSTLANFVPPLDEHDMG